MSRNKLKSKQNYKTNIPDIAGIVDDIPLLMNCYSHVNSLDSISTHFNNMIINDEYENVMAHYCFALAMLLKLIDERGIDGLLDWSYDIRDVSAAGLCDNTNKIIIISEWILEDSATKFDDIYDTIIHEIAHANRYIIAKDTTHGPEWQEEAIALGGTGDACLPPKYAFVERYYFNTIVCHCTNETDKCVCIAIVRKTKIERTKKLVVMCEKHDKLYEITAIRELMIADQEIAVEILPEYGVTKYRGNNFGNTSHVHYVADGEVVELEDGDIHKVEPIECMLYD